MDIPELLLNVATYLSQSDRCACALVCRTWNESFTPDLYREINVWNSDSFGIARHSVHARILRLPMFDAEIQHLDTGSLTRVQELEVTWDERSSVPPMWVALLQRNPELVTLTTRRMSHRLLQDIVPLCPHLQELKVYSHRFCVEPSVAHADDDWRTFWRICQGLTHLGLFFSSIPVYSGQQLLDPAHQTLPAMRRLDLCVPRASVLKQIRLISACHHLETLKWRLNISSAEEIDLDLNGFQTLFQSLDQLREIMIAIQLSFQRSSFRDNWTRQLMKVLPPLREFEDLFYRAPESMKGLVTGPLSGHFRTLERLILRGWKEVTSEDNHLILISCPNLQTFASKVYKIGQIPLLNQVTLSSSNGPRSEQGPLGWVCTRLTDITLEFVHETPEKSRLMFEQLSHMNKLEAVTFQGRASGLAPSLI